MLIDINNCDLNNDYFHFSNKNNIQGILNDGLKPTLGPASKMVGDEPNVSVSMGARGIMGIINSFIFMFSNTTIENIPEEYKKYYHEISDFSSSELVDRDLACKAMTRKLKDEVYFRVRLDESHLNKAQVGGLTGFDIKMPVAIDKTNIDLVSENGKVLSAYDVSLSIYNKVKDNDIFREFNEDFFYMFENKSNFYSNNEHIEDIYDTLKR